MASVNPHAPLCPVFTPALGPLYGARTSFVDRLTPGTRRASPDSPVVPPMSVPESLLLGALLGVAYSAAAVLVARRARAMDDSNAVLGLVLGGMLVRMALALVAFGAILAWVPVLRGPFVAGLGVTFVIGMAVEMSFLMGRTARPSDS